MLCQKIGALVLSAKKYLYDEIYLYPNGGLVVEEYP